MVLFFDKPDSVFVWQILRSENQDIASKLYFEQSEEHLKPDTFLGASFAGKKDVQIFLKLYNSGLLSNMKDDNIITSSDKPSVIRWDPLSWPVCCSLVAWVHPVPSAGTDVLFTEKKKVVGCFHSRSGNRSLRQFLSDHIDSFCQRGC